MSEFYGTIDGQGCRQTTRSGSKKSGLTTHAACWQGAVRTTLSYDEVSSKTIARVDLVPWRASGGEIKELYCGHIDTDARCECNGLGERRVDADGQGRVMCSRKSSLDTADLHTILAALRWYQHSGMGNPANRPDWLQDIACPSADATSLGDTGIDALCETLA